MFEMVVVVEYFENMLNIVVVVVDILDLLQLNEMKKELLHLFEKKNQNMGQKMKKKYLHLKIFKKNYL